MIKAKIIKKSLIVLFVAIMALAVITFAGCSANDSPYSNDEDAGQSEGGASNPKVVLNQTNRKIIYTVDVELVTKEYDNAIDIIYEFIFDNPEDNHWISSDSENSYDSGQSKVREMTLKIKTEKLNDFLSALPDMGEVEHYNLSTEDITYDYAQTQAEKSALEDERAYYQGLLATLEEESQSFSSDYHLIQELTTKIKDLNSQIKLINDELTKYDNELDFSMVKLTIRSYTEEQETPKAVLSFGERVKKAFFDTTNFLGKAFKWIFIILIYVFPFAIIAGIVIFVTFVIRKKIQARRQGREKMNKIKDKMSKD